MISPGDFITRIGRTFVRRCPKTGRIVAFRSLSTFPLWLLPLAGLMALVWFLVRVLPKPSRAAYPCQRVAAPLASGFIVWLAGSLASVFAFRGARRYLGQARIVLGALCAAAVVGVLLFTAARTALPTYAQAEAAAPNVTLPVGTPQGLYPGRVIWAWDPAATNPSCTNDPNSGDEWWRDKNTSQAEVDSMLSQSLQRLTNTTSDADAWTALFKYFNQTKRNLQDRGYTTGEKIVIKVNLCSAFGMVPPSDGGSYTKGYYSDIPGDFRAMPDTSPQLMRAIIKSLVKNNPNLNPSDVSIGDPYRPFFDQFYNAVKTEPAAAYVQFLDAWGGPGRTFSTPTTSDVIFYSNRDTSDPANKAVSDKLPQAFVNATYMINMAAMKGHELAGVTLCAKNHFGSQSRIGYKDQGTAQYLHYALPTAASNYGSYRVLVDLMGHKYLGGKTVLYLVDGLWGGYRSIPTQPNKWKSAPFNNSWPSSLLMSEDPVAIDSVGYDFLKEEYQTTNGYSSVDHTYPNSLGAVDDYLLQAASSAYWPTLNAKGQPFSYDPENDGAAIGSLGVYDHWNNATEKKYHKNLVPSANGIELVAITPAPPTAVRINAGDGVVSPFAADAYFIGGTQATNWTGAIDRSAVVNPAPEPVYRTERWGLTGYTIPGLVPNSAQLVRLHFCENYFPNPGSRVFTVFVNGVEILTKLDIRATTGAMHKAYVKEYNTTASSSGQVVITFTKVTNNPLINGIEVIGSATPTPTTTATPTPTATWTPTPTVTGPTPTVTSTATATATATPTAVIGIRINSGDGVVDPFVADVYYSGGSPATNWTGAIDRTAVVNPAPEPVYRTERWGLTGYTIPGLVPNSTQLVRLHFCENYFPNPGSRVFTVFVNGAEILTKFDIRATTGAMHKAYIKEYNTTANSSGQVVITFTKVTNNPLINGIEVLGAPPSPTATATATATYTPTATPTGQTPTVTATATFTATATATPTPTSVTPTVTATFTPTASPTPTATSGIKINAGNGIVSPFVADVYYSGGTVATNWSGTIDTSGVTNPAPQAVYRSERWGNSTYTLPGYTAGSTHTIRLHFCENYFTTTGSRRFTVKINGVDWLIGLDILSKTNAAHRAYVYEGPAVANASGQFIIQFIGLTNNALINGIEVN